MSGVLPLPIKFSRTMISKTSPLYSTGFEWAKITSFSVDGRVPVVGDRMPVGKACERLELQFDFAGMPEIVGIDRGNIAAGRFADCRGCGREPRRRFPVSEP